MGKSTMGWFFGFKLHLLCNEKGEILNFVLTKGNVDDRDEMVFKQFDKKLFGKLYADRGYISPILFEMLWSNDVYIVAGIRANVFNVHNLPKVRAFATFFTVHIVCCEKSVNFALAKQRL